MSNASSKASDRRPVEEIDAIMVKYSAWASSRAADPPPPSGIREVSYSSALHASNARRKVRTDLVLPAENPGEPPKPPHKPKGRQPKSPSTRRQPPPVLSAVPAKKSARQPTPVQPKVSSEMQPANRIVALSVRLAAEECALVRMRAAESRLSVSAYVRQCVLDVDAMRIFIDKISAELHATAASAPFTGEPAQLHSAAIAAPRIRRPISSPGAITPSADCSLAKKIRPVPG